MAGIDSSSSKTPQAPTSPSPPKSVPRDIAIDLILVTKKNLRTDFDTAEDAELAADIKRRGVLSRVWVRDNARWNGKKRESDYDLIAGERRVRAAKAAGLIEVPCEVFDVDDETLEDLMTIENLQRQDLHELDYAAGFARMIQQRGYTVETLAQTLSKGKTFIRELLGMVNLPEAARQAFRENKINKSIGVLIATIPDEKQRENYATQVIRGNNGEAMTFRQAKELKERDFMKDLKGAPFPLHVQLDPAWPHSCLTCPYYNGNTEETRQGKRPNICLNPRHYPVMVAAWARRLIEKAEERGDEVLSSAETKEAFVVFGGGNFHLRGDKYLDIGTNFYDSSDGYKSKPWGPVIKKGEVKTVVAIDPSGHAHKLALKAEAEAAARAQGFNKGSSRRDPKIAAETKKKNAVRKAVAVRIVARLGNFKNVKNEARYVALIEWMIDKMGGTSFLCKQLSLDRNKTQDWDDVLIAHARALKAKPTSLATLLSQILIVDVIESWAISDWGSGTPDKESLALCKLFGINIRAIQSQELARYNTEKAARAKKKTRKPATLNVKAARA